MSGHSSVLTSSTLNFLEVTSDALVVPLYSLSNEKPELKLIIFYCCFSELEGSCLLSFPSQSAVLNSLFIFIDSKFDTFYCPISRKTVQCNLKYYFVHFIPPNGATFGPKNWKEKIGKFNSYLLPVAKILFILKLKFFLALSFISFP